MKRCPYCAELIADNSSQCEFCQSDLQDLVPIRNIVRTCPYCKEPVPSIESICPYCKSVLIPSKEAKVADETCGSQGVTGSRKQELGLSSRGWKVLIIVIIALVAVLLAIDIWQRQDKPSTKITEQDNAYGVSGGSMADKESADTYSQSDDGYNDRPARPNEYDSSEYILPDSDTLYLDNDDVDGLTRSELAFARNEIFARHGYVFSAMVYKEYFESQRWYMPNPYYDNSLNQYEKANVELIRQYENQGGPSYDCDYAKSDVERMICDSPELSKADQEMASLYRAGLQTSLDKSGMKRVQDEWRSSIRDKCSTNDCLASVYEKHIELLKAFDRSGAYGPSVDGEWKSSSGRTFTVRTYGDRLEVALTGGYQTFPAKWISSNTFEFKSDKAHIAVIINNDLIEIDGGDVTWTRK